MNDLTRLRILVICTGNSARSQIAEGLFRTLGGDQVDVASAGSNPGAAVHPLAVEVMGEIGIDISGHHPKPISQFVDRRFDYVIAVCSHAAESCPFFPGPAERLNWFYDDPAAATGSLDERLEEFRTVRDDLRRRIASWLSEHLDQVGRQLSSKRDCVPLDALQSLQKQMAVMKNVAHTLCGNHDELTGRVAAVLEHVVVHLEATSAGVCWLEAFEGPNSSLHWPADQGLPAHVAAILTDPGDLLLPIQGMNQTTWLAVPIRSDGVVRGRLWVAAPPEHVFGEDDRELSSWVADQLALVYRSEALMIERNNLAERQRRLSRRYIGLHESCAFHVSRELHDEISQSLAALIVQIDTVAAKGATDAQALGRAITHLRQGLAGVVDEINRIVQDLRPTALETHGLMAALSWYASRILPNVSTRYHVSGGRCAPDLPPDILITLYRIGQQALANVAQHARAKNVWLDVFCDDGMLTLVVKDDGIGFDLQDVLPGPVSASGMGLLSMQERAELAGGNTTIESTPGHGSCIQACIPVTCKLTDDN